MKLRSIFRSVGLCLLAWWPMQVVHELGHVLGCQLSGATVQKVILWPWTISQTIRSGSTAPAVDTWFGPIFGAFAPAVIYLILVLSSIKLDRSCRGRSGGDEPRSKGCCEQGGCRHSRRQAFAKWVGLFAGYCLIVNGAYLGLGWIDRVGDAGDLLRAGVGIPWLCLFGVLSVGLGLLLWHVEGG